MSKPLVSVICLCYNHDRFVEEAIESVIRQTYEPLEIIVWDDASTDNSPAVIVRMKEKYPQLQIVLSKQNEGNCKAFNGAFSRASGDFIVDFSTDDVMLEHRLARQVDVFARHDSITGVVFTDATYIDEHGSFIRNHYEHLFAHKLISSIAEGDVFRNVLTTYYIASPTMMMRRSVLDLLGGYDETLSYEDFDLWVRSARVFRYAYLDERLTRIRKVGKSMSAGWYHAGDRQLLSTYHVCLKAIGLCRNEGDRRAVIQRARYELKHAALSGNRTEASLFAAMLDSMQATRQTDIFWRTVSDLRIPLAPIRRFYQELRYDH